jgi:peptide/nickel transport system substrate-binding protein
MNRRDRLAVAGMSLLLAAVGAVMLLSASGAGQQPPSEPESSVSAVPSSATSTTYREGIFSHPSSINPLTARTQADRDLVALVFRGLLRAGPNGSLVPDLATSWSVSSDGKTYTFNLRDDARWEDGEPVTATDVVFTVTMAQDPAYEGPLGASWQGIQVAAASPSVVKFTLPTPLGGFLRQATLPILPEHLLGDTDVTALADSDYSARPVGDGPFSIAEIDDTHVLLTRTGASYEMPAPSGSASTAPTAAAPGSTGNVASIEFVFYDDVAAAVTAFESGQLDALGGLTPQDADAAAARGGSVLARYPWANLYSVVLNQRSSHPELANLNVRKALLAAIDRPGIVAGALSGRGAVADVPLPSWSSSYDQAAVSVIPYSGSDALDDLDAAGWTRSGSGWTAPNGKAAYAIRLLSPDEATNPLAYRIARQVAAGWTAVGLSVTLQVSGASDYVGRLTSGDFDAAVVDYQLGLDPDVSALLVSTQAAPAGWNLSGVSDKTLDGLLSAVRTTSDPTARQAAVSALEKYVSTNVLMLPVCFADYEFVVADRLHGLAANQIADPSGRFWDVLDWRLASDG